MKFLAIKWVQLCFLVTILASIAFGRGEPENEARNIKSALGCVLTADWARQDLRELGLKAGAAALIRYTTAPIPGTSPDSGGLLKIFVYDRREKHAWLMFAERHDDRFLVVHNAYRLARSGKSWIAGEGNGGIATYEAIGKFASRVYDTEPRMKMTVEANEHACQYATERGGKKRDPESRLDYFGARFYGAALGRWTSPDPHNASAMLEDPQSWNAYSYVRNNPLALVDPFGENYTVCDNQGQNCADLTDKQFQQYLNDNQNVSKGGDGTLRYYDDNGTSHNIGSASYYNEKAFDGTAALTGLIKLDLENAALGEAGGLLGRAVGAALDARTATAVGGIGPVLKGAEV